MEVICKTYQKVFGQPRPKICICILLEWYISFTFWTCQCQNLTYKFSMQLHTLFPHFLDFLVPDFDFLMQTETFPSLFGQVSARYRLLRFPATYRTRAIKGRTLYSKNILWTLGFSHKKLMKIVFQLDFSGGRPLIESDR